MSALNADAIKHVRHVCDSRDVPVWHLEGSRDTTVCTRGSAAALDPVWIHRQARIDRAQQACSVESYGVHDARRRDEQDADEEYSSHHRVCRRETKVRLRGEDARIRSFCLERLADPELSQRDTWFWKVARLVALSDTSTSFDGEPCDRTKEGSCLCGREWSLTMLTRETTRKVTGGT
jgi:hypothetical protein